MNGCDSYKAKIHHFLVPALEEFGTLCKSYDKTFLFFIVLTRLLIYYGLTQYLFKRGYLSYDARDIRLFGFIFFIIIIFGNLILLTSLLLRKQKFPKIYVEEKRKDVYQDFTPISFYESDIEKDIVCPIGYKKIR